MKDYEKEYKKLRAKIEIIKAVSLVTFLAGMIMYKIFW